MLEIDHWNYYGARQYTSEKVIDGWGWLSFGEAIALHTGLRKGKSFSGLESYQIPGVMEQGGADHPPLPYLALVTKPGKNYLLDPDFFAIAHGNLRDNPDAKIAPGDNNGCTYKINYQGQAVYIKSDFFGWTPHFFMGMHLLASEGVHIAPLLFATQHLLITKEVEGQLLYDFKKDEEVVGEYRNRWNVYSSLIYQIQEKLIKKNLWFKLTHDLEVEVDLKSSNLIVRDFTSVNPLDWFTFIDCVQKYCGKTENIRKLSREYEQKKYGFSFS
jgi:hypothetical protein